MMINEQTGEVTTDLMPVEEESQDFLPVGNEGIALFVDNQRMPLHMRHLPRGGSLEQSIQAMRTFSEYVETPTISLKALAGEVITVIGAIIYEQGPYTSFADGQTKPGYYEVRLKLDKTESKKLIVKDEIVISERHVIARSSGKRVAELIVGLVNQLGWYDWEAGLQFEVGLDEKHGAIYLRMI